jgi:hypothetical protein
MTHRVSSHSRELHRNITASISVIVTNVVDGAAVPTLGVARNICIVVVPWRR